MKRQNYYPSRQAEQIIWLENFRNKLAAHATALGLDAALVTGIIADARWLIYLLGSWLPAARAWQKACTEAAERAQSGTGSFTLPVFTPPALPAGVVARDAGALDRIFDLVQEIKVNNAYTAEIGLDLRLVGPEAPPSDPSTVQPVLGASISGNQVLIDWGWQGLSSIVDQCEIQVDRGTGWALLTIDTTPGYTDTHPHPATPARWKYRAIYRLDDAQTGLWSAEVGVNVGG